MSTIQEVEQAILGFAPDQRAEFDAWYANLQAAEWDRRFEQDVTAGRFEQLADELRAEIRAGRARAL